MSNSSSRQGPRSTTTGKFVDHSGAPTGNVIRGTRMPDGSTFVTIAPETREKASSRATQKIAEFREKARRG
jgi:hypothetical protein